MDEKLLPPGEENQTGAPAAEDTSFTLQPQHEMYIRRKVVAPEPMPVIAPIEAPVAAAKSAPVEAPVAPEKMPGVPSPKQQQWGVVISIVIIVLMVIIGAFYAWGERIAQNQVYPAPATSGQ